MKEKRKAAPSTDTTRQLEGELEDLAVELLRDARNAEDLPEKTAAFRAVSAYYAMTRKLPAPESPAENTKGKFNGHAQSLGGGGRAGGADAPAVDVLDRYPGEF